MHFGINFTLNTLYYPFGGKVRTLLQIIDFLFESLLLSLKAAKKELRKVLYFSSS